MATGNASSADAGHIVELQFRSRRQPRAGGRLQLSQRPPRRQLFDCSRRMKRLACCESSTLPRPPRGQAPREAWRLHGQQQPGLAEQPQARGRGRAHGVPLGTIDMRRFGQRVHLRGRLLPGSGRRVTLLQDGTGQLAHARQHATRGRTAASTCATAPRNTGHTSVACAFRRRPPEHEGHGPAGRADDGLPAERRVLVRRRRLDRMRLSCPLRSRQPRPPVWHQGDVPLRRQCVTAVVDDRGPFVGGRDWDLNQNTAARAELQRRRHGLVLAVARPGRSQPVWDRP